MIKVVICGASGKMGGFVARAANEDGSFQIVGGVDKVNNGQSFPIYTKFEDIKEKPDVVINIVDATNIERNLYLSIQLIEMERPVVIALNMMDEVSAKGDTIDVKLLSEFLNIPVVPVTAKTGEGTDEVIKEAIKQAQKGFVMEPDDLYDDFTHQIHHKIDNRLPRQYEDQ